jgi:hypothetical protein
MTVRNKTDVYDGTNSRINFGKAHCYKVNNHLSFHLIKLYMSFHVEVKLKYYSGDTMLDDSCPCVSMVSIPCVRSSFRFEPCHLLKSF